MRLNKYKLLLIYTLLIIQSYQFISGQQEKIVIKDNTEARQTDILDVFWKLFPEHLQKDTVALKGTGLSFSIIPVVGYSMHTGITGVIATSTTFYTDDQRNKTSRVVINGNYSQFHQYWVTGISNIFIEKHNLHLFGDARYYKFPTQTYGLGPDTPISDPLHIDYSYLRFYQAVFFETGSNFFFGIGYNLDYHWNVKVDSIKGNELDQFVKYQKGDRSISSGMSLNITYDNRKNVVNPQGGTFVNVQFRPNMALLGSNTDWQSLLIEIRHYIKFPASSQNILALWSYNNLTVSGTPPYLDMPSIGWDNYSNTGRGYAPGRYTGRNLIYFESEYRFSLTKNGLLGAVIFGNAESISDHVMAKMQPIIPGGGFGLRIKINKYSNTNLSVDYGFGIRGSRGLFFNIGEVF